MELSDADRERLHAARQHWVPDDQLDGLPDLELLAEANRRGVLPPSGHSVTRREVIDACRGVTAALDAPPPPAEKPLAERTKPELLAAAKERGLDVPSSATKPEILAAINEAAEQ